MIEALLICICFIHSIAVNWQVIVVVGYLVGVVLPGWLVMMASVWVIIFSTTTRALCETPRNITRELLLHMKSFM